MFEPNQTRRNLARNCLCLLLLALPLLVGRATFGSYGAYPHNDDFLYARGSKILVEEGRYQHVSQYGSLTASVAGHILWGACVCVPLGYSYSNLHLSVAIAAWLGAVAVFFASKRLGATELASLLVASVLVVGPYYYGMSFTFMTDVTAVAFVMVAVWAYTVAIQTEQIGWHFAGAIATSLALWTRQTHLVTILYPTIAYVGICFRKGNWKPQFKQLVVAVGLPIFAYIVYDRGLLLPGTDNRLPRVGVRSYGVDYFFQSALHTYQAVLLTGLATLPLVPILVALVIELRQRLQTSARIWADFVGTMTSVSLLALFFAKGGRIYITQATGYILNNGHYGPILLADQFDPGRWGDMGGVSWSPLLWQLITVAAIAGLGLQAWLVVFTIDRWHLAEGDRDRTKWSCCLAMLVTVVAAWLGLLVVIETLYDRYWMLFYPFVFVWLATMLSECTPRNRETATLRNGALGTLVLVLIWFAGSFVMTHDFLAWNHVRGLQVDRWLNAGLEPQEFDAGNGINGWYRSEEDFETFPRDGDDTLYWRGLADTALSIGPRKGWETVDRLSWYSWAARKECEILVIKRTDPNAPSGP